MQLLVSVRNAEEASAALDGGADVIDAKDPDAGPLGAVTLSTLRAIVRNVAERRAVSAALGDAADRERTGNLARAFVDAGAQLVKIGFAGVADEARAAALLEGAAHAAGAERVVAVAYADFSLAGSPAPMDVLRIAARTGVAGILLDTADKRRSRLPDLVAWPALADMVAAARDRGLLIALAGQLGAEDMPMMAATGADIAGVRGAACDGGRGGRVSSDRVRQLRSLLVDLAPRA